jgi:hypothetical protein
MNSGMFFNILNRKLSSFYQSQKSNHIGLLIILFIFSLLLSYFSFFSTKNTTAVTEAENSQGNNEIEAILQSPDIEWQKKYYLRLINRIGVEKAQEELMNSGLEFNGNTHLLNHAVGEFIFEKYGPEGISKCKDYFSSSCYHGIIINTLSSGNLSILDTMLDKCREKGEGSLLNCVHGMGHGFLPWVGYANLTKALDLCDRLSERSAGISPDACYTGVFMENIWGVHDGKPSPDRWIKNDDKHYPCNDPRISERYLNACWQQQHTIMIDVFDLNFDQVANECIGVKNKAYQKSCFEGLFQSIHGFSRNKVNAQINECGKMPVGWINSCISNQLIFGVAQGDDKTPFELCDRINRNTCYKDLIKHISYFISSPEKIKWCSKIPSQHRTGKCSNY